MAGIGIGNMGSGDLGGFSGPRRRSICGRLRRAKGVREAASDRVNKHYGNNDCKTYNDFRELLARKTSTRCISPRPTIGTRSSRSRPAATARTFIARSPSR